MRWELAGSFIETGELLLASEPAPLRGVGSSSVRGECAAGIPQGSVGGSVRSPVAARGNVGGDHPFRQPSAS